MCPSRGIAGILQVRIGMSWQPGMQLCGNLSFIDCPKCLCLFAGGFAGPGARSNAKYYRSHAAVQSFVGWKAPAYSLLGFFCALLLSCSWPQKAMSYSGAARCTIRWKTNNGHVQSGEALQNWSSVGMVDTKIPPHCQILFALQSWHCDSALVIEWLLRYQAFASSTITSHQ